MRADPEAIRRVRDIHQEQATRHAGALAWRQKLAIPHSLVWLPGEWAMEPAQGDLGPLLLSANALRRIRRRRHLGTPQQQPRLTHALNDRIALPIALAELFPLPTPDTQHSTPKAYLSHTALGQPVVRWHGAEAAERVRRDLHISFSHDGEAHLTLAACALGLRGVGVDAVYLPRLRQERKDAAYLHRFARHFMSEEEYAAFETVARHEGEEAVRRRVAAHFSLMEAASKALGTGLKIGGGMGRSTSLPKQSVGVLTLAPEVIFTLGEEARERCQRLGAFVLKGYWATDAEYLISAVFLYSQFGMIETNSPFPP